MDSDFLLVLGVVIAAIGFPALLNSFSSGQSVRMAIALFVIGAALVVLAIGTHPGGYSFADVPRAFIRVFAEIIN